MLQPQKVFIEVDVDNANYNDNDLLFARFGKTTILIKPLPAQYCFSKDELRELFADLGNIVRYNRRMDSLHDIINSLLNDKK